MGRLCGGAHEISGIKAPIFLRGWVGFGGVGGYWWHGVSGDGMGGWMGGGGGTHSVDMRPCGCFIYFCEVSE